MLEQLKNLKKAISLTHFSDENDWDTGLLELMEYLLLVAATNCHLLRNRSLRNEQKDC